MGRKQLLDGAREKIIQARREGGVLREVIVRGHGCCMVNDPDFDQALWDEALVESERLRGLLRKARGYVAEPGPPGTVIETTEESAQRSSVLLAEIDEALGC